MIKKITALVILLFAMLACSKEEKQEAPATQEKGKIAFVQGSVELSGDNKAWKKAALNTVVTQSDWIKTGKRSIATIAFWKSTQIKIHANARVQLKELAAGQKFELKVIKGKVGCQVEKIAKGGRFSVGGPSMVAGVRGTRFDFYTDGKKDVLKVNEGKVAAKRKLENAPEKMVNAGESVIITRAENEVLKKKLSGKSTEEQKKLMDVKVKETRKLEEEMPQIKKEMDEQDKFTKNKTEEQDTFVKKKSKEVEEVKKKGSKAVEKVKEEKSKEIEDATKKNDFGKSMLDKAKAKRNAQQKKGTKKKNSRRDRLRGMLNQ